MLSKKEFNHRELREHRGYECIFPYRISTYFLLSVTSEISVVKFSKSNWLSLGINGKEFEIKLGYLWLVRGLGYFSWVVIGKHGCEDGNREKSHDGHNIKYAKYF